jgi:uncharacterized membrane protein YedE/YeeE
MDFCPNCGTTLKGTTASQEVTESNEQDKTMKQEILADAEIREKNQYGFVRYLIAGLILCIVGISAILDLTGHISASGQDVAFMLIIIGIIIIIGAIYVTTPVRKYFSHLISHPKKEPANT